ncbi:MAG: prolyl oligopeptidase family serine peptidase [Chloroflexi bacterium]|nr:prolyl oligopeptidase family serine peptidase [Chloroflexota bacterium]
MATQFWTSRGYAVLDVNYRGSSGYGRAYRQLLEGNWGIADVDDCCSSAAQLAEQGLVDEDRLTISGGSAGGFTTLAALTFRNTFHAGSSYFGISDLTLLAKETHKFESRYLDKMIGPWPAAMETYRARSPLYHAQLLNKPVILFQGLDDKVVPPNQAEVLVHHLVAQRVPHAYVTFPGEGHGFRQATNISRALECELYFFARVLNLPLQEALDPVPIPFLDFH